MKLGRHRLVGLARPAVQDDAIRRVTDFAGRRKRIEGGQIPAGTVPVERDGAGRMVQLQHAVRAVRVHGVTQA